MELREQAEILNHSNVLVLDEQTRVIMWNAGCERLYGYKSAEAIGKSADELLNTQFPVSRAEAERQLREVGVWQGELIQTARSGERVVVASDWTLYQREPDKPSVILEVNNDITGRRRAEDALMEADINKDRFLLTLGHELRNPLGAILNSVKLLRLPGVTSETATRALDIVERQLNNVIRLVEDRNARRVQNLNVGRRRHPCALRFRMCVQRRLHFGQSADYPFQAKQAATAWWRMVDTVAGRRPPARLRLSLLKIGD
jgi:PAS domain S-box-containing protein